MQIDEKCAGRNLGNPAGHGLSLSTNQYLPAKNDVECLALFSLIEDNLVLEVMPVVKEVIDDPQLSLVERGKQIKQPDFSDPRRFRLPPEEPEHCGDTFVRVVTHARGHYVITTRQRNLARTRKFKPVRRHVQVHRESFSEQPLPSRFRSEKQNMRIRRCMCI